MLKLSKLAAGLGSSAIREMYNEALKTENAISFTVGEPDFITAKPIIETACRAWRRGLTHYTPNAGVPELRRAIAQYHRKDFAPCENTQVFVSCGATEALQMALFTLVDPGDEVILITPAWPNYFGQIGMCGAVVKPVCAHEKDGFVPDPAAIQSAITPKTKAIILNSPSNPTGAVIDRATYRQIIDLLVKHDIYVIADEVYSRLVYGKEPYTSILEFPEIQDKVVYINSFSKMFAMTGWRLGYAVAGADIIRNMVKLHENGVSCLPAPSQLAAAEALLYYTGEIDEMRDSYHRRRDIICSKISEMPGLSCRKPGGAFYAFVNIEETGLTSRAFCLELLRRTGVVTVPGSGFGEAGEGYVRLTYAISEDCIQEGLARMGQFMKSL